MQGDSNKSENPYVGTRPFRIGEALYGREREARELHDLLIAERIVLLYSPSRAGKTSLIQARLIPELEADGFLVPSTIRVIPPSHYAPPNQLHSSNRYILSTLLHLESELPEGFEMPFEALAQLTLADYLKKRLAEEQNAILIFDQCEDILTQDPTDTNVKRDFFRQVGEVLQNRCRWALFAIREEYRAGLLPYQNLIPTHLKSDFRLDLLERPAALQAVQQPALQHNVKIADDVANELVDRLRWYLIYRPDGDINKVLGTTIDPEWLQVVCQKLWKQRRVNPNKISNVELGGIVIERREYGRRYDRRNERRRKRDRVPEYQTATA
jgi:hypothetical protein